MSEYMLAPGARLDIGPGGKPYESLGFYSLAPGARLDIGPGGRPYESMGACCTGCAKASLGAANPAPMVPMVVIDPRAIPVVQPASPSSSSSSMLPYLVVAGAGLIGLVVYLRRRKRR